MRRLPVMLLGLIASACAGTDTRPCGTELDRVRRRESLRIHGLSQNDNLSETVFNLQSAAACARDEDAAELRIHLHLLATRLLARGDVDGLAAAARVLGESGVHLPGADAATSTLDAVKARLDQHASALAADPGQDALLRAALLRVAVDGDEAEKPPATTRIMVLTRDRGGSCVVLYTRNALPAGTAVLTVERAGKPLPLSGDATSFGITAGTPRVVRACIQGPLQDGDVARVSMGGAVVHQQALVATADDDVRGALRAGFDGRDLGAACAAAVSVDARIACALRGKP